MDHGGDANDPRSHALTAIGCVQLPTRPKHAETDFTVEDTALATELEAAAADWAVAGLVLANYLTTTKKRTACPLCS